MNKHKQQHNNRIYRTLANKAAKYVYKYVNKRLANKKLQKYKTLNHLDKEAKWTKHKKN